MRESRIIHEREQLKDSEGNKRIRRCGGLDKNEEVKFHFLKEESINTSVKFSRRISSITLTVIYR